MDGRSSISEEEFDYFLKLVADTFVWALLPWGAFESFGMFAFVSSDSTYLDVFQHATYAYDTNNRLLSKTPDPSFSAQPVSFTYYNNGVRKTMVHPSGTTSYVYDNRNRLQTKQTPAGTLNYIYDNALVLGLVSFSHLGA